MQSFKKSAWKVFLKHHTLLSSLGEGELTEEKMKEIKEFVCKMYKLDTIGSVDEARAILFSKKGKPEALPLTSDALSLHVKCALLSGNCMETSSLLRASSSRS